MVLVSVADGSTRVLTTMEREIYPAAMLFAPDGRLIGTVAEHSMAAGACLAGSWNLSGADHEQVPGGVFWLRAQLDGHPLGSERVVLVR